jgi:hypothetical protein
MGLHVDGSIGRHFGRHVSTPSMMGMGNESPASPELAESETMISPMNILDSLKEHRTEISRNFLSGGDANLGSVNGKSRFDYSLLDK